VTKTRYTVIAVSVFALLCLAAALAVATSGWGALFGWLIPNPK
jgi:hypothetical protein